MSNHKFLNQFGEIVVDVGTFTFSNASVAKEEITIAFNKSHNNGTLEASVNAMFFNIQTRLFTTLSVAISEEINGTLGFTRQINVETVNLYLYNGMESFFTIATQILWVILTLLNIYKLIHKAQHQRWEFFKSSWNFFEIFLNLLLMAIIGVFVGKIIVGLEILNKSMLVKDKGIDLTMLFTFESVLRAIFGIAYFVNLLLFFRNLSAIKQWAIFMGVLSRCRDIRFFCILFSILTFAFAVLGNSMFASTLYQFSSISQSILTLLQNVIGVSQDLFMLCFKSNLLMSYTIIFSSLVTFLSLQCFMSILTFAYTNVSKEIDTSQLWDRELSNYIYNEWLQILGNFDSDISDDDVDNQFQDKPIDCKLAIFFHLHLLLNKKFTFFRIFFSFFPQ